MRAKVGIVCIVTPEAVRCGACGDEDQGGEHHGGDGGGREGGDDGIEGFRPNAVAGLILFAADANLAPRTSSPQKTKPRSAEWLFCCAVRRRWQSAAVGTSKASCDFAFHAISSRVSLRAMDGLRYAWLCLAVLLALTSADIPRAEDVPNLYGDDPPAAPPEPPSPPTSPFPSPLPPSLSPLPPPSPLPPTATPESSGIPWIAIMAPVWAVALVLLAGGSLFYHYRVRGAGSSPKKVAPTPSVPVVTATPETPVS